MNSVSKKINLFVTLTPEDAGLLRAAVPAGPAQRDQLGNIATSDLVRIAMGSVCRGLLAAGYQPTPVQAELLDETSTPAMPANVIKVQLA